MYCRIGFYMLEAYPIAIEINPRSSFTRAEKKTIPKAFNYVFSMNR